MSILKIGDKVKYDPIRVIHERLIEAEVTKVTRTYVHATITKHQNPTYVGMELSAAPKDLVKIKEGNK